MKAFRVSTFYRTVKVATVCFVVCAFCFYTTASSATISADSGVNSSNDRDTARNDFLSSLAHPSLVVFYRSDCAPCRAEIKILPELAREASGWKITIAALTGPNVALTKIAKSSGAEIVNIANPTGDKILRSFSDSILALPFAFATDKTGSICAKRLGLLGTDIIKEWKKTCSL